MRDCFRAGVGQRDRISGVLVPGECVLVRAWTQPDLLEARKHGPVRKVGAVPECHVLQQVREPALAFGFVLRARVDAQPQIHPPRRICVRANPHAHAIVELVYLKRRVLWDDIVPVFGNGGTNG